MKTIRFAAAAGAVLLLCACGKKESTEPQRRSFIERIQPADFYAAEVALEEPLSRNYDLVFLRTDFGKPISALALQREPAGGFTLLFGTMTPPPNATWQTVTTTLDDAFARQVARAVELKLHRHVTLSSQTRQPDRREGDLWVLQKLEDGKIAAALITLDATLDNPEATEFVDELIGGLRQLVATPADERNELITKLDRLASHIVLKETPRPDEKQ